MLIHAHAPEVFIVPEVYPWPDGEQESDGGGHFNGASFSRYV